MKKQYKSDLASQTGETPVYNDIIPYLEQLGKSTYGRGKANGITLNCSARVNISDLEHCEQSNPGNMNTQHQTCYCVVFKYILCQLFRPLSLY